MSHRIEGEEPSTQISIRITRRRKEWLESESVRRSIPAGQIIRDALDKKEPMKGRIERD